MVRAYPRASRYGLLGKRALDLIGSLTLFIVLAPLWLAVAVAIKLTSPGPLFHRYAMVGKDGKIFWGQKFRSMVVDAHSLRNQIEHKNEMNGPVFKITNDPRVTPVGRWLRKFSVDEVPQLWNVLKGDMSLVGPRPPGPYEFDKF